MAAQNKSCEVVSVSKFSDGKKVLDHYISDRHENVDNEEGILLSVPNLQAHSKPTSQSLNNNNIQLSQKLNHSSAKSERSSSHKGFMGQTGNRTESKSNERCDEDDKSIDSVSTKSNLDLAGSLCLAKLEAELAAAQEALSLKDVEIDKLSKIREEVEGELHDLTASLFQEAHKMVQEANVKAAAAERSLAEATMKIDGLETEVSALKTLVSTSTPARPKRHLLPTQSELRCSRSRPSSASSAGSPALNGQIAASGSSSTLVVGAGGLFGTRTEDLVDESEVCCCGVTPEKEKEKLIDPNLRKDFLAWKKDPSFDRDKFPFLEKLYKEDIDLCLDFPNKYLSESLREAVECNSLCINPLVSKDFKENSLPQSCALFEAPLLCRFHVRILPSNGDKDEVDFFVSQLARNRIIAVCDCLTYLRYIKQGMVKSHSNDVYWQVLEYRKKMALARLGFSPD